MQNRTLGFQRRHAMTKLHRVASMLAVLNLLLLPSPSIMRAQDLSDAERQERCENNKARLPELEKQAQTLQKEVSYTAQSEVRVRNGLALFNKALVDPQTRESLFRQEWLRTPRDRERTVEAYDLEWKDEYENASVLLRALRDASIRQVERVKYVLTHKAEIRQQQTALDRQIASHRNNLVVLKCDGLGGDDQDWSGTWTRSDGVETINITGGGASISATFQYQGGDFSGNGQWSNCRLTGSTVTCDFSANHDDSTKSGERKGTVEMTLSGNTMSGRYLEGQNPKWSWKPGYGPHNVNSSMVEGAVFNVSYTRK
jgi:hypothetical protein